MSRTKITAVRTTTTSSTARSLRETCDRNCWGIPRKSGAQGCWEGLFPSEGGSLEAFGRSRQPRRIQHLAHLARQRIRSERLLQKRRAWVELPVMDNGLVGVARHKEDLHVGTRGLQKFRQFAPAHPWHDNVGHQQVDRHRVLLAYLNG